MEASTVVIDTDVLIDLLRNKKETVNFIASLQDRNFLLTTTVINLFELQYAAHKSSSSKKNLQATEKLLDKLHILPLSPDSSQMACDIFAELEAKGQTIGLRDTLIAAIALTQGFGVVTQNASPFKGIPNLGIITPESI